MSPWLSTKRPVPSLSLSSVENCVSPYHLSSLSEYTDGRKRDRFTSTATLSAASSTGKASFPCLRFTAMPGEQRIERRLRSATVPAAVQPRQFAVARARGVRAKV